jgi:hypothetical protein
MEIYVANASDVVFSNLNPISKLRFRDELSTPYGGKKKRRREDDEEDDEGDPHPTVCRGTSMYRILEPVKLQGDTWYREGAVEQGVMGVDEGYGKTSVPTLRCAGAVR